MTTHFEEQSAHYVVALRQTQLLQRTLINASLQEDDWWSLVDDKGRFVSGIELTRFEHQADSWSKPRWVTGVRQHIDRRDMS